MSIIKDILDRPARLTFAEAAAIRSDLLAITRTSTDPLGSKAVGAAKRLAKSVDSAMERGARNLGGEALQRWRQANKFWKEEGKTFNNKFIKALANKEPDELVNALLNQNIPRPWRRVRDIVTNFGKNLEAWREIQGSLLEKLVKKSFAESKTGADVLVASAVRKKLNNFGEDTLKEIFPDKGTLTAFRLALSNVRIASSTTEASLGKVVIQLTQAGAITSLVMLDISGFAVAVAIGPVIAGKLFANPKFVRWLVTYRMAPDLFVKKRAAAAVAKMAVAAGGTIIREKKGK